MVSGGFDPIHIGRMNHREARRSDCCCQFDVAYERKDMFYAVGKGGNY